MTISSWSGFGLIGEPPPPLALQLDDVHHGATVKATFELPGEPDDDLTPAQRRYEVVGIAYRDARRGTLKVGFNVLRFGTSGYPADDLREIRILREPRR